MSQAIQAQYEELIRNLRPDAKTIESLGTGDINDVLLVDSAETFRFPKTERDRGSLRYEAAILRLLENKLTLQFPSVVFLAEDASYGIFSYIPGHVLSSEEIMALPESQKQHLARKLAYFMCEVADNLSVEQVTPIRAKYIPWMTDDVSHYAELTHQPACTPYINLFKKYYESFFNRISAISLRQFVFHNDIHYGNLIFDDNNELRGVIDFSDCGPETVYSDLRQLYRLGEDLVSMVIDNLGGKLGEIDLETVRLNAIVHEFSVLMRPESQPPNESPRAKLAKSLLSQWLGEEWGKL